MPIYNIHHVEIYEGIRRQAALELFRYLSQEINWRVFIREFTREVSGLGDQRQVLIRIVLEIERLPSNPSGLYRSPPAVMYDIFPSENHPSAFFVETTWSDIPIHTHIPKRDFDQQKPSLIRKVRKSTIKKGKEK